MTDTLRVALAQRDFTLGDLDANVAHISAAWRESKARGEDLIVFPQMAICGWGAQDMVQKPAFIAACEARIRGLAEGHKDGPAALVGGPALIEGALYNAVWLLEGGEVRGVFRKWDLPNYGVFDEKRLFTPGPEAGPIAVRGVRIGVLIGEDSWSPHLVETLAESGAEILIAPNASPYERGKYEIDRIPRMVARVVESGAPLAYLNGVGGQDELVFDGGSFALDQGGALAAQAPFFEEASLRLTFKRGASGWRCQAAEGSEKLATPPGSLESDYWAMATAVKGFAKKGGFEKALIGFTGGAGAALAAIVAVDALGPEQATIVAPERDADAAALAESLGCRLQAMKLAPVSEALEVALPPIAAPQGEAAAKDLPAQLFGFGLSALAEASGALLLSPADKTDFALCVSTIGAGCWGDLAPLKDLYRTRALAVGRWRSKHRARWMKGPEGSALPPALFEQAAAPGDWGAAGAPPLERLDAILEQLVEGEAGVAELAAEGYETQMVRRIEDLLARAEAVRRRAPPGPKLGPRAFGPDRRYPIVNRWRDGG